MAICAVLVALFVFATNRAPNQRVVYLAVFPGVITVFLILPFFSDMLSRPISTVIYSAYVFTSMLSAYCYIVARRNAHSGVYGMAALSAIIVRVCLIVGLLLGWHFGSLSEGETFMHLSIVCVVCVYVLGMVVLLWSYRSAREKRVEVVLLPETFEESVAARADELTKEFGLTSRERDVLVGLAHGNTAASIARDLFLSTSTVQGYIKALYVKLGVNRKQQVIDLLSPKPPRKLTLFRGSFSRRSSGSSHFPQLLGDASSPAAGYAARRIGWQGLGAMRARTPCGTQSPKPSSHRIKEKGGTMALSRRDFLKVGGSACLVAGAGAALAGCSPNGGESGKAASAEGSGEASVVGYEPVSFDQETDILIIGTGYAGLAAAMAPALAGKKIVLAEKQQMMGGDSAGSCCFMFANGTQLQLDAGYSHDDRRVLGMEHKEKQTAGFDQYDWYPEWVEGKTYARTPKFVDSAINDFGAEFEQPASDEELACVWRRASSCRATASGRAASAS